MMVNCGIYIPQELKARIDNRGHDWAERVIRKAFEEALAEPFTLNEAKRVVKDRIRMQGLRIGNHTAAEITRRAKALMTT